MQPETTIYLIRHAHAEWREDEGRSLSSEGIIAAHVVAERAGLAMDRCLGR